MAYTQTQLEELWIAAGGNPQEATKAASVAMGISGGDPNFQKANDDGSVSTGLWGINSSYGRQSSTDPMTNARGAVAVSKNGSDWDPVIAFSTAVWDAIFGEDGDSSDTGWLAHIVGVDALPKLMLHVFYILGGLSMMIVGVVLMIIGSKNFRKVAGFAAEVVGSGVGFGLGASLLGIAAPDKPAEEVPYKARGTAGVPSPAPPDEAPTVPLPLFEPGDEVFGIKTTRRSRPRGRRMFMQEFGGPAGGSVRDTPRPRGSVTEEYEGRHKK